MVAAEVVEALQQECKELELKGWKWKSSEWHHYKRRQLLEGSYATEWFWSFSESLDFSVFKGAIRNFEREVIKQLKESKDVENITIPAKKNMVG